MSAPVYRLESVKFRRRKLIWKHFETLEDGLKNTKVEDEAVLSSFNGVNKGDISCIPFVVEFRRLLGHSFNSKHPRMNAIPGVYNKELLHAVVGLYDICLPDITPEVLYNTVCGKYAKTIILVRETAELISEMAARTKERCKKTDFDKTKSESSIVNSMDAVKIKSGKEEIVEDCLDTIERQGTFDEVFSDTDDEEDSSSSDEDEDYSKGLKTFLKLVQERRKRRQDACSKGDAISTDAIGIESQIVACATWKKSHICPGEKINQICLMGVRRRCRKTGIGKYLIQVLKDTAIVGLYDTLVVYADPGAVNFFASFGFKDDIVLNSKYEKLVDNWTNSTLMCYLPPFAGHTVIEGNEEWLDLEAMELEFEKLTKKSRDFYQTQYQVMERLKHEIITLRTIVKSQKKSIKSLSFDKELLQKKYYDLEKTSLLLKMRALKAGIDLEPDHFFNVDS